MDYLKSNHLSLKTLDVQITERCSLKCKDCSNLMQYYTKPQNAEMEDLFFVIRQNNECHRFN